MPDAPLTFVEHKGHRLAAIAHSCEESQGLPVVWIHGLTMSVRFWEAAMYETVRENRSWFSISLPFHYPSEYKGELTAESLSEDLFAELIAVAIDQLIPTDEKVHLVGHSLGAFAALNYAAKHPARVASVVSIGGFMRGRAKGIEGVLQFFAKGQAVRRALFDIGWQILKSHPIFLKIATICYARDWKQLLSYPQLDATLSTVFPDLQKHNIEHQRELFRYLLEMELFDEIDEIKVPVLMVVGDKDPIIPAEHQIRCASRLENSELLLCSKVGHLAFAERPDIFEPVFFAWLDRFDRNACP